MRYRRYKNELDYSYALGMAPVMELIGCRPASVLDVFAHPDYRDDSGANIFDICEARGLRCVTNEKVFNLIASKDNIFVIAAFRKWDVPLSSRRNHVVFVNPADAGNLGSNLRTCLGFGFGDVAIIKPGADIFAPKTARASMGALFHINAVGFSSFGEYASAFPDHRKYLFMLNGKATLSDVVGIEGCAARRRFIPDAQMQPAVTVGRAARRQFIPDAPPGISDAPPGIADERISLVFGNEATGLPDEFLSYGTSVRIPHSSAIDSLNLTVAVGIALHAFTSANLVVNPAKNTVNNAAKNTANNTADNAPG